MWYNLSTNRPSLPYTVSGLHYSRDLILAISQRQLIVSEKDILILLSALFHQYFWSVFPYRLTCRSALAYQRNQSQKSYTKTHKYLI